MRKFIVKTAIFIMLPISLFFILFFGANGYTDPFYLRFTTPPQKNLILGTSRAAQGLQPLVFEQTLEKKIYNYSFTVSHSPFGAVYYKSIKQKLAKEDNEYFIVTIDPWSLSSFKKGISDTFALRESNLFLGTTNNVSACPNFEYLFENFRGKFASHLMSVIRNNIFLHDDGWLEIRGVSMDSNSVASRTKDKIKTYQHNILPSAKFSAFRLEYLKKTVAHLKTLGDVFIVRLPVSEEMMELENILAPDFDQKISEVITMSDGYLDMTPDNKKFQYTDGNHLHKDSGALVSREIAEWIKKEWADEVDN